VTQPVRDYSFGVVPVRRTPKGDLYLLIQHRAGHWAFPKGHAEPGETPVQTARRELAEETGIRQVEIREKIVFIEHYDTVKRGRDTEKTVTYFLGWVQASAVTIQPEEVRDFAWLNYAEAGRRVTYEETRRVLDQVQSKLADGAVE
jgi:8-oxo-dGTP pyrophosphatase MutT (NUDIX family)